MVKREQRHARRRRIGWLLEVLVVGLVVAAFAGWHLDAGTRLGTAVSDRGSSGAEGADQEARGLRLPRLDPAQAVARPLGGTSDPEADPAKVSAAISRMLGDKRLGPRVDAIVTDLATGHVVFRRGDGPVAPASTMKLLTSAAALQALGPETRFHTVVRRTAANRIVLVGGGDPYLARSAATASSSVYPRFSYPHRATMADLATQTAAALEADGVSRVRLAYDDSMFSGPTVNPRWPSSYRTEDVVPPITALWVDEGRDPEGTGYADDPSRVAADTFRALLAKRGIAVAGPVSHRTVPATTSTSPGPSSRGEVIGDVASATLGQITSRLELVSDNNAAEVVAHHVGRTVRGDGSFAGGAAAVRQVLEKLGVTFPHARIYDGSGLSRQNRLDPITQAQVLGVAASPDHPRLRQIITGLPVAGFSGSLADRFDQGSPAGLGQVQAKTGTLTGVHGLAGVVTDRDDTLMGFVVLADRVPGDEQLYARTTIDKIAAALADCRCAAD